MLYLFMVQSLKFFHSSTPCSNIDFLLLRICHCILHSIVMGGLASLIPIFILRSKGPDVVLVDCNCQFSACYTKYRHFGASILVFSFGV